QLQQLLGGISGSIVSCDSSQELRANSQERVPLTFVPCPLVTHGYLVLAPPGHYTVLGDICDHRRGTESSRLATAPSKNRVRDFLQQPDQASALRHRVEGAEPAAQVFRRRPHELLPALPL